MSNRMSHNTDRWSQSDPEELAFEAARLQSSMDEIEAYIELYGREPVTLGSGEAAIVAPAWEAHLRHHRRLSDIEL